MKIASWFTPIPEDHVRIGISRGTPRRMAAGYRLYKALAPGPWFNSVGVEEYYDRYRTEILGPLDPRKVRDELQRFSLGKTPVLYQRPEKPTRGGLARGAHLHHRSRLCTGQNIGPLVLLCYERPGGADWCHRAMAAEWLAEALGRPVPEFGYETVPQGQHPLMPPQLRREIVLPDIADVTPFIGRSATIEGEIHLVVGPDIGKPGMTVVSAGDRRFSTGIDTLRPRFSNI